MMGLVDADVVLLDDYRPDCQLVDIATMLSWLESGTITICRPLEPVRQPLAVQGRAATLHDVQFQAHSTAQEGV